MFKSFLIYRLTKVIDLSADRVATALAENTFVEPAAQEFKRIGFVSPYGGSSESLVAGSGSALLLSLKTQEKILPNQVVRDEVAAKMCEIEDQQCRKVKPKEKSRIKDEVVLMLLPRAFSVSKLLRAVVLPDLGLIVVEGTAVSKAEELLSLLRMSLGSLPVVPLGTVISPQSEMTQWLKSDQLPTGWGLGFGAELREPEADGAIVRCRRHDLKADEIKMHLNTAKQVTALDVDWQDRLKFRLGADLSVRQFAYSDVVLEGLGDEGFESRAAKVDADLALFVAELKALLPSLICVFGGLEEAA